MHYLSKNNIDKAKPRVIVGRLSAVIGGGPTVSEMEQWGKPRVLNSQDSRVAEGKKRNRITVASVK